MYRAQSAKRSCASAAVARGCADAGDIKERRTMETCAPAAVADRAASKSSTGPLATGPLEGVRILDLSSVIMGPWATQNLADMGADVICVEAAGGDAIRFLGQGNHPYLSGVALNGLRNKRNVALNLKNPDGREAFLRVAATCDVVLTNLRPGPRARLGLDYADLRKVRPDIIYCHAQGWGADSDRADDPAYDDVIQAAGGMAALFVMQNGRPSIAPVALADQVSSLAVMNGILAALYHRQRTGEGQVVEIPMIDVMAAFTLMMHGKDRIMVPPLGPAGYERMTSPLRAPLPTRDGFLQLVLYTKDNWADFFVAGGVADAHDDPRLKTPVSRNQHYVALYGEMAEILKTRTTAEWIAWCDAHGVANSPVVTLEELIDGYEVVEHPQGGAYRRIPQPIRFSATPATYRREAPLPGEHNHEVLAEAGYSDSEIAGLEIAGGLVGGNLNPR
jgi:crotonobetainyl-CoA:carnitine CoA-transferase CaiB-like acyl-CoA transferase